MDLSTSAGNVQQTFSPDILNYTLTVLDDVTHLSLTVSVMQEHAVTTVYWVTDSGEISTTENVALRLYNNSLWVVVIAGNGVDNRTYFLNVFRTRMFEL